MSATVQELRDRVELLEEMYAEISATERDLRDNKDEADQRARDAHESWYPVFEQWGMMRMELWLAYRAAEKAEEEEKSK